RFVDWAKVSKISLDKENLILHTGGDAISVDLGGLLEDPVWILDRALAWRSSRTGEGDRLQATAQIEKLQAELADVSCTACGGRLPVELGQERLVCGFCGGTNVLKEEVKNSLRRVGEVVRNLPAAHRQVHKQSLRRYMTEGAGIRRRMVWAGGLTAAVMILFAIIDGISTSLNQSGFAMNLRFTVGMSVLAALSLATGLLLSYATRRVALSYALPMQAIPPLDPGGAARCRLCGADLPEKGILRRCEYCGTDSIVTGARLARVERTAHQALEQARAAVEQSTEGAARVLDKVAGNLAAFANLQFFWLHIPILVALDGYHGPLRITGICVAVILASLIAGFVGIRWLQREQQAALE
ncbi:MAG: hypothetical protein JXQ27_06345, partial [Acidobacteria bacterium]|nr:hypothetical protein [Acidobacteriota bacterium]